MKITEHIAQADAAGKPFWSLEFFPPKTSQGLRNLYSRIARMTTLNPAWVQITWGAGGSTQERSLQLAGACQQEYGVDACLHLTCTNMEKELLDNTLAKAKDLGIRNVLALRGDPPRGEEYWIASDPRFQHAVDLVKYIREQHGDWFCIGVAGYPEGHPDAHLMSASPSSPILSPSIASSSQVPGPADDLSESSGDLDVDFLKAKQDAGADFVVTQLFYDVDAFLSWLRRCREHGITIPILPGIMPIQSYSSFRRLTNLCRSSVPTSISAALEPIRADDAKVKSYGVRLAIDMVKRLYKEDGIKGFHLCTLNLEKSVRKVLEELTWVEKEEERRPVVDGASDGRGAINGTVGRRPELETDNPIISDRSGHATPAELKVTSSEAFSRTVARASAAGPISTLAAGDRLPVAAQAQATSSRHEPAPASVAIPETGPPLQSDQAVSTWDEFPNGRFGDSRSPAYGELDGWGVSLKVQPKVALRLWGTPTSDSDISRIFVRYLESSLRCVPWCDEPLLPETRSIQPFLLSLNEEPRGWWTVGSQPAVDGVKSEDEVYGFGPRGGYVFQKAFVEFFLDEKAKDELVGRVEREGGNITYYAGNRKGELQTNTSADDVNAVTWGVFPGKEIVQPTIIEEESFKAWKEEAFAIWSEWEVLYPPRSASRQLLRSIGDSRWLVTIVHHDYKDETALWRFLLGDEAVEKIRKANAMGANGVP